MVTARNAKQQGSISDPMVKNAEELNPRQASLEAIRNLILKAQLRLVQTPDSSHHSEAFEFLDEALQIANNLLEISMAASPPWP